MKTHSLVDSYGVIHEFSDKSSFAKLNSLNYSGLSRLISGEIKFHKGWSLLSQTSFILCNPKGFFVLIKDISKFCKENGFATSPFIRFLNGNLGEIYKGWELFKNKNFPESKFSCN